MTDSGSTTQTPEGLKTRARRSLAEFGRAMSHYPRAMALTWSCARNTSVLFAAVTVALSFVPAAQIWTAKRIMDEVAKIVEQSQPASAAQIKTVLLLIGLQILISVGNNAVESVEEMAGELTGNRVSSLVSRLLYQKLGTLDLAFFETPAFVSQTENVLQQSRWGIEGLLWTTGRAIQNVIVMMTMVAMLYRLHPLAPVAIVLFSLPRVYLVVYFANRRHQTMKGRTADRRMMHYLSGLLEWRDAVKEIRLFGLQEALIHRYEALRKKFVQEDEAFSMTRHAMQVGVELLGMLAVSAVWVHAVLQVIAKRITLGDLGLYFQTAQRARDSVGRVFSTTGRLYEDGLALGSLFEFLDLDPLSVEGALARAPVGRSPAEVPCPLRTGLEFRNVSFKYPGTQNLVLQDVSFTLRPGERVALVGSNGAGKTTLVKLMTRYYDPGELNNGEILLEEQPLWQYSLEDLRRQISVVFQDFMKYRLSVRDNIGFGEVGLLDDQKRIEAAAEKSGVLPVIGRLPRGWDTILDKSYEGGADLSGGEWQRIALARAFVREAQIVVLDEPTASLDPEAEEEIFERFGELTAGKISLIISHRFSTVRSADRILVLQDGRLVEQGTHEALMALDGVYTRMYNMQASRYG